MAEIDPILAALGALEGAGAALAGTGKGILPSATLEFAEKAKTDKQLSQAFKAFQSQNPESGLTLESFKGLVKTGTFGEFQAGGRETRREKLSERLAASEELGFTSVPGAEIPESVRLDPLQWNAYRNGQLKRGQEERAEFSDWERRKGEYQQAADQFIARGDLSGLIELNPEMLGAAGNYRFINQDGSASEQLAALFRRNNRAALDKGDALSYAQGVVPDIGSRELGPEGEIARREYEKTISDTAAKVRAVPIELLGEDHPDYQTILAVQENGTGPRSQEMKDDLWRMRGRLEGIGAEVSSNEKARARREQVKADQFIADSVAQNLDPMAHGNIVARLSNLENPGDFQAAMTDLTHAIRTDLGSFDMASLRSIAAVLKEAGAPNQAIGDAVRLARRTLNPDDRVEDTHQAGVIAAEYAAPVSQGVNIFGGPNPEGVQSAAPVEEGEDIFRREGSFRDVQVRRTRNVERVFPGEKRRFDDQSVETLETERKFVGEPKAKWDDAVEHTSRIGSAIDEITRTQAGDRADTLATTISSLSSQLEDVERQIRQQEDINPALVEPSLTSQKADLSAQIASKSVQLEDLRKVAKGGLITGDIKRFFGSLLRGTRKGFGSGSLGRVTALEDISEAREAVVYALGLEVGTDVGLNTTQEEWEAMTELGRLEVLYKAAVGLLSEGGFGEATTTQLRISDLQYLNAAYDVIVDRVKKYAAVGPQTEDDIDLFFDGAPAFGDSNSYEQAVPVVAFYQGLARP